MTLWLTVSDFAEVAGIAERRARRALARAAEGHAWRGALITTRERSGRGGRSGQRFEGLIVTFPADIQLRWKDHQLRLKGPAKRDDAAAIEREYRHNMIRPALEHPRYTPERAAAVRLIAATPQFHPVRGSERVSERTLQRYMADYENAGYDGLTRRERADKSQAKAIITRGWDRAATHVDEADKLRIAGKVVQRLRDLWGNGASLLDVTRLASEYLAELTHQAGGFDGSPAELARACALPRNVVERYRKFRRVHERRTDAKAFDDQRPRMRMTGDDLAPMQLVIGDVHRCDVLVTRADGSKATPRIIAWLDVGTGRVRCDIVLCDAGKDITNADLIRSFLRMVADTAWGMPSRLYLDNGSEYRFAEFVRDAMKLAGMSAEAFDDRRTLIRATAYNAAAKGKIERAFGEIERALFATMPGYIAGDRMRSKSANLGKPPAPYGGSFEQWSEQAQGLIGYYNTRRQRAKTSPSERYHLAVQNGWQRLDADEHALFMAFSIEETRKVTDGKISVGGDVWYADELFAHNGETVTIRRPKYTDWSSIPVWTKRGERICLVTRDVPVSHTSRAGAEEASRRRKAAFGTIDKLAQDVGRLDIAALMRSSGEKATPATPTPKSAGKIGLSDEMASIGRALAESPDTRRDREKREKDRRIAERIAIHARFRAAANAGGGPR